MAEKSLSADSLLDFISRIERLELEKKEIQSAIKEVYDEASSSGLEAKIMRKIVGLRKMDAEKFKEQEVLLAIYKKALGMHINIYEEDLA